MTTESSHDPSAETDVVSHDPAGIRIWPIETLVRPHREALIRHDGQTYRLRITSNGRLILTK